MPWEAIKYVGSGLTLAAFIVAAIAWILKSKSEERERLIDLAKEDDRAGLVRDALEFFRVDTAGLTKAQQYQLALEQIRAHAQRFKVVAVLVCLVAILGAVVAAYAITRPPTQARYDPTPTPNPTDPLKEGEAAAAAWFAAFKQGDLDTLVRFAAPPFYFDNQVLLTREDVRQKYSAFFNKEKGLAQLVVTKIQVMTIADLKKIGAATGDRMLMSLRLTDDDIVSMIFVKTQAIGVYFRRSPTGLEMAGFWD